MGVGKGDCGGVGLEDQGLYIKDILTSYLV